MKWLYLLCFVSYITIGSTLENNTSYKFNFNMATRCKEHLALHGYTYSTYYSVYSDDRRPIPKPDPTIAFEMHIAILASSNGHILLSPVPLPDITTPVYEIVVGGGGNKFTELRRNLRRNAKTSTKTIGILSAIEFRAFYIRITEDGLIEFGREGEPLPLLSYYDVNPLTIRYFSFAAWNGVEAKFLYDCPAPGQNGTESSPTDSQPVEPKLSNSDKLKRTLLLDRMPNLPPGPIVTIKLGVTVTNVMYDAFDSKLVTSMALVTSWTDDSMAWNPLKFNVTSLTFRQGQIWRPTFFVFNSNDIGAVEPKNSELISMVYSGEATFHFQTRLKTFCVDYTSTFNQWPRDEYRCSIVIGPWEAHERISIEEIGQNDVKMKIFAVIDEMIQNEWEVTSKQGVVSQSSWTEIFNENDNQTYQSDRYVINLNLKRRATSYNIIFYTPLLVLVTFVLMSFWSEPLQMSRIWFYSGATVVVCIGLCYIDYLVPCHTIPSILILYTTVLVGILLALLIHVALMTSTIQTFCKGLLVQTILTSKIFRTVFCLPPIKTCRNYESINEAYSTQEDDDSGVMIAPRNGNIEEMQAENTTYGEKEELAEAIDKLLFVVYSVVFAVMLACHF